MTTREGEGQAALSTLQGNIQCHNGAKTLRSKGKGNQEYYTQPRCRSGYKQTFSDIRRIKRQTFYKLQYLLDKST